MIGIRALLFILIMACAHPARGQDNDVVRLRIDVGDSRHDNRSSHFRSVCRASGPRDLRGHLGGARLDDPEHAGNPQRRGGGAQGAAGAGGSLARRLLCRRISLAQGNRAGRTSARRRLNPNWGGVIEPNTFGTHEFLDFVQQIGADAYISVNVGSGTSQEAAEWLEYMTADKPSALAQERAGNGHPDPYKIAFLGIGNESWGCGGTMSPEYYLSQLKIYSRYARNYNGAEAMQRIAVGPDGGDVAYTETIMKAWQSKVWSWNIEGLSLHSYTVGKWPPSYKSTGFGEAEYAALIKETLRMEELIATHSAIMERYDPQKKIGLMVDEWGAWLAPNPGNEPGISRAAEQPARRHHCRVEHQHLRPPRGSRAHGEHRPNDQCTAGHDPHRQGQDDPHTDVPRLSHVRAISGCTAGTNNASTRGVTCTETYPCRGWMRSQPGRRAASSGWH